MLTHINGVSLSGISSPGPLLMGQAGKPVCNSLLSLSPPPPPSLSFSRYVQLCPLVDLHL